MKESWKERKRMNGEKKIAFIHQPINSNYVRHTAHGTRRPKLFDFDQTSNKTMLMMTTMTTAAIAKDDEHGVCAKQTQ